LLEEGSGEIVDLVLDRSTSFLGDTSLALLLDEGSCQSLELVLDVSSLDEESSAVEKRSRDVMSSRSKEGGDRS